MAYSEPGGAVLSRTDLDGGSLVWLLEVQMGTTVLRWSSRPVSVVTEAGEVLGFNGGLDARSFGRRVDMFSDNADPPEASFTTLPAPSGFASLIAAGDTIAAQPGELSLWVEGTTYEKRQVMVWGHTQSPRYGGDRDPIAFTLGARALEEGALFPDPAAVVESGNFTTLIAAEGWSSGDVREDDEGKLYPVIFGRPGGAHDGAKGGAAYVIHEAAGGPAKGLLIAYGRVASQFVTIYPMDGTAKAATEDTFRVLYAEDDRGRGFSYVDVSGKGGAWATAPGYFVQWADPAGGYVAADVWHEESVVVNDTGAGADTTWTCSVALGTGFAVGDVVEWVDASTWEVYPSVITSITSATYDEISAILTSGTTASGPQQSNGDWIRRRDGYATAINDAGEAAIFMLQQSTKAIDLGRWQALRRAMSTYKIDVSIREPVKPWEWVRKALLRNFLPVSITATPDGMAPIWWRYDARPEDAVAHLEAAAPGVSRGGCVVRDSDVECGGELGDIANFIHIKYAPTGLDGAFRRGLAVRGYWLTAYTHNRISSVAAQRSHALYGERRVQLDSHTTATPSTVAQVLNWLAVKMGFIHRSVTYAAGKEYGFLQLGDPVTLTDTEIGESNRVALVTGLTQTDGPWMRIRLQLVTNPETAAASTGPNPDSAEGPSAN